jgi:uncharacterized membrane protein YeaQ/YmgE (transglycosylase-associated protein family)
MIGAIILGILAGFAGRFLMPGREPLGFFATVLLGLAGAVLGWLVFTGLLGIGDTHVFDLGGLVGAIVGVMILLGAYRLLARTARTPSTPSQVGPWDRSRAANDRRRFRCSVPSDLCTGRRRRSLA